MVELGMHPRDALTAATATAAELMGLGDRGRIAEGRIADLLIVDGDPMAEIAAVADSANHRAVIKNGAVVAGILTPSGTRDQSIAAASL